MKKVKGVELSMNLSNELRFKKFCSFEINPCKYVGTVLIPDVKYEVEQCNESEAEFWSVYIRLTSGCLECIADCETKELAEKLVDFLQTLAVTYKPLEE